MDPKKRSCEKEDSKKQTKDVEQTPPKKEDKNVQEEGKTNARVTVQLPAICSPPPAATEAPIFGILPSDSGGGVADPSERPKGSPGHPPTPFNTEIASNDHDSNGGAMIVALPLS